MKMMRNKKWNKPIFWMAVYVLVSFWSQTNQLLAQEKGKEKKAFTLDEAVSFALKNHVNILNAEADRQQMEYKKKEVVGMGLPQINASVDLKDYLKIPTSFLPDFISPAAYGVLMKEGLIPFNPAKLEPGPANPVQFGLQYNATAGANVSQLLFSSDYILGVKAAKELAILSTKNVDRSKTEVQQNVTKAFYLVLVNKERLKLLDANDQRLKKLLSDMKAMNKEGFVESIDVERLEVAYNNLMSEKEKIYRLVDLSLTVLKFQMGMKVDEDMEVKGEMSDMAAETNQIKPDDKVTYNKRPEYALLEQQHHLYQLDLKRNQLSYLPNMVAYGSFNYNAQRSSFDFFDKKKDWFPIVVIGASLNIPVFDGFQKHFRIQQAKLNVVKTENSMQFLQSAIEMERQAAWTSYQNALTTMASQKKNMDLAQHVFDVCEKKYTQGLGTNLEVVNAQTSLKEAQTNYYNALYDMLLAKVDYLKAVGELQK